MKFKSASPSWWIARNYCMKCSYKNKWFEVDLIAKDRFYIIRCKNHNEEIMIPTDEVFMKDTYRVNGPHHISFGFFSKKKP